MEAFYSTTHTGLYLCQLTPEHHARTCNYWFTVTTSQALPHIAFTTREELEDWLTTCGLKLPLPLSPHGEHSVQRIEGTYRTAHYLSYDSFYALNAIAHRKVMSNGQRTLAIVTEDESGVRSINTLSPNMKYRFEYDFRTGAARPAFERDRFVPDEDVVQAMLQALKDVSTAYQQFFDVMPVAWQTYDHIVTAAIAKAEGGTPPNAARIRQ